MAVQGGLSFIPHVLQCSAEYSRKNSLWVFGQEIGVDTLLFPHALSILQEKEHNEIVSRPSNTVVAHHQFEHNTLLTKASSYRKYMAVMQHWYVHSDIKENGHFSPRKTQHTTLTPMLYVLLVLVLVDFCWPCTHTGVSWKCHYFS